MCNPLINIHTTFIYCNFKTHKVKLRNYLLITSSDSKTGTPPMAKHDLSLGKLARSKYVV